MLIVGVDIETTGLDVHQGHRIVEIALDVHRLEAGSLQRVKTLTQRIDPLRPIEKEAYAVHHISYDMVRGKPTWEQYAPNVAKILGMTKIFVAHNASFDAPFVATELARVKQPVPACQAFCTMENGRFATALGKLPSLAELCAAFGIDYDETAAHAADYDIIQTMECLKLGMKKGYYKLPGAS